MDKAISICVIPKLNSLLEDALCNFQTTLIAYNSLDEAQRALSEGHFSLIVIDASTLTIERTKAGVEHIRLITNAPIMILVPSEAAGSLLKAGADICISNHVAMDYIVSHALALLRRYTQYDQDSTLCRHKGIIQEGDFFIDPLRRIVQIQGRQIDLRPREFSLLLFFAQNPGVVLTAEQVCEYAWRREYEQGIGQSIYELRKKIEKNPAKPCYIQTVYRIGYRFIPYSLETCDKNESSRKIRGK